MDLGFLVRVFLSLCRDAEKGEDGAEAALARCYRMGEAGDASLVGVRDNLMSAKTQMPRV